MCIPDPIHYCRHNKHARTFLYSLQTTDMHAQLLRSYLHIRMHEHEHAQLATLLVADQQSITLASMYMGLLTASVTMRNQWVPSVIQDHEEAKTAGRILQLVPSGVRVVPCHAEP